MFQCYAWNQSAAQVFADREAPYVICVESDSSAAIIPAAIRTGPRSISLLGEELFDYRDVLSTDDDGALRIAFGELSRLRLPFHFAALRGEAEGWWSDFELAPFSAAPFARAGGPRREHRRLKDRFQELAALGCKINRRACDANTVGEVYRLKAAQGTGSLFRDPLRIQMVQQMVMQCPEGCELITLTSGQSLVAAALGFRDGEWCRFYATYYDHKWARFSPGVSLANEMLEDSLARGLDFDFMTGEQPYKLRLASGAVPLFRVAASSERLAEIGRREGSLLRAA
jgi:hypothetical protein